MLKKIFMCTMLFGSQLFCGVEQQGRADRFKALMDASFSSGFRRRDSYADQVAAFKAECRDFTTEELGKIERKYNHSLSLARQLRKIAARDYLDASWQGTSCKGCDSSYQTICALAPFVSAPASQEDVEGLFRICSDCSRQGR